jgi:phosphoribosylamine--glycine ligase
MLAACDGALDGFDIRLSDEAALTVVLATRGYPGAFERGSAIRGVAEAEALPGVQVFQAGTREADGRLIADGGRVLGVTGTGRGIAEARERAYAGVERIDWPDGFCRRDIGARAVEQEAAG